MQIYLLAANLFALAALLLGWSNFSGGARNARLLPLFLLVVSRSVMFIIAAVSAEKTQPDSIMEALEVFSTFCVVWTLAGPVSMLSATWQKLTRLGQASALLLCLLLLLPFWPVPFQLHSLIIAIFSASFILQSANGLHWSHLAAPLALALAGFVSLVGLPGVSWLLNLLAYAFLVSNVHWQGLYFYALSMRSCWSRQQVAEALAQESVGLNRERQRLLNVSEMLSAVPNLNQSMEHIVRSMARATHVDQSALFMLDAKSTSQARLVAVYSPARPVHVSGRNEVAFNLVSCPPLQEVIESQRQLLLPEPERNGLVSLYNFWGQDQPGPTLFQPLIVQGRPVGVLVLGNPISNQSIRTTDARLCQSLAPQIATMVEHRRRYLELELQVETGVTNGRIVQEAQPGGSPPAPWSGQPEDYLEILELITDGLVVSDTLGRVWLANRAAERILGKPRRELVGQPISTIYGEIDSGEPLEDLVVAFSRRDQPLPTFIENDERAIQGRLIPWRNQQREWLGIVAIFRDVTRELKADRARADFLGALSQELRAPLTAVKGYSDLILQGALGDYLPEQLRLQRIIQSSADRMAAVLNNASRIDNQNQYRVLPRIEEVDITRIINESLHEVSALAQLRQLRLTQEIKGQLPVIAADPRHLRGILDNLLANACHFTPPGGYVTVRAWVQPERDGNTRRPFLYLAVADNGIGIPPVELKRIFEPFYQVKSEAVIEQRGMGLGLAVVKELVELHKGRVWAESVVGEGSIFQVALPLTQE